MFIFISFFTPLFLNLSLVLQSDYLNFPNKFKQARNYIKNLIMCKQISVPFIRPLHEFRKSREKLFICYKINDFWKFLKFDSLLFFLVLQSFLVVYSKSAYLLGHRALELYSIFFKVSLKRFAELTNFSD